MTKFKDVFTFVFALLILVSIAQFAVGWYIFTFTTGRLAGTWWVAICLSPFLVMICAVDRTSKCQTQGITFITTITLICITNAIIIDGRESGQVFLIEACADSRSGDFYGDHKYSAAAVNCIDLVGQSDCSCVKSNAIGYPDTSTAANFTVAGGYPGCLKFNLAYSYNTCGEIMTTYEDVLVTSTVLVCAAWLCVISLGIMLCECCPCGWCDWKGWKEHSRPNIRGRHRNLNRNNGNSGNDNALYRIFTRNRGSSRAVPVTVGAVPMVQVVAASDAIFAENDNNNDNDDGENNDGHGDRYVRIINTEEGEGTYCRPKLSCKNRERDGGGQDSRETAGDEAVIAGIERPARAVSMHQAIEVTATAVIDSKNGTLVHARNYY